MIQTIDTFEKFAAMHDAWHEVLSESRSSSVFLTHEWLSTWWKHLSENRKLLILAAYDGERLLGILPLALRPPDLKRMMPQTLEFIGSGIIGSDYLDAIVRQGCEDKALAEFEDYLEQAGHVLQLSQLRRAESIVERMAENLAAQNWTVSSSKLNICPYINLEGQTWEGYCATLSSNQRYNFQRRVKNLSKLPGFRLECVRTPEEARAAVTILMELHKKRWESRKGQSEAFQTPEICKFHEEFVELAAARGWLRLYVMWVDKAPVAALYGLRYGGIFSFYQSGFDPDFSKFSVGLVMMGLAIKSAVDEGCREYDFLHGGEEYKFHWTQQTRELGRLELFPALARARFYKHALDLNRTARRMAKRVLQRA